MKTKVFIVSMLLSVLVGCTASQRGAGVSASLILLNKDVAVQQAVEWIGDDQTVLDDVAPSFKYLEGRLNVYKGLNQATQAIPLILQRQALWAKAKVEIKTMADGLVAHAVRTNDPMPLLVESVLSELTIFVAAVDDAIEERDTNVKIQYLTDNLGRVQLLVESIPRIALAVAAL